MPYPARGRDTGQETTRTQGRDMNDSTKRLLRISRLPQAALDHADKILAGLPPLTDRQRADLSVILYGAWPGSAAA